MPETFWDPTTGKVKGEDFSKHVTELQTFKAADDVRRNALPQKAEDYKYELPKDFQAPQGLEFKFNENDASLQASRAAAKEMGLTQDQYSKILSLYAGNRVTEMQKIKEAREAEMGKLGTTANARISSVNTFLNGYLGEADAKHLQDSIWTAGAAQAWEKLITKIGASGSGFSQQHRNTDTGKPDDATYAKWSFAQRMNYASTGDPNKAAA